MLFRSVSQSRYRSPSATGTLYFDQPHGFYVGQTVVISGNGSKHNGSKTITAISLYSITYSVTGNNITAAPYHPVAPYGSVAADTYVDFSLVPEIREASLLIAVDIWQARQLSNAGGVSPDGFTPSPYRMGNTLLARVRGLIANYLKPSGLVG